MMLLPFLQNSQFFPMFLSKSVEMQFIPHLYCHKPVIVYHVILLYELQLFLSLLCVNCSHPSVQLVVNYPSDHITIPPSHTCEGVHYGIVWARIIGHHILWIHPLSISAQSHVSTLPVPGLVSF